MKTVVVILNYRTPDLTIDCLRSLEPEICSSRQGHVIVVEGGSGDDSGDRIAAAISKNDWSAWATLLRLAENRGYAASNNAGIRAACAWSSPPQYILILNPDTVVRPGAVRELEDFMDAHPQAGIAGSRLEHHDCTPQSSAFRFPSIWSELEGGVRVGCVSRLLARWRVAIAPSASPHRADWVTGASFLFRRELLEQVGMLDEAYFLYYEELDFCLQASRAGWECWHVPQSRVVHLIGQSTGVSRQDQRPKRRPGYWFDSRQRYFRKNYGCAYALLVDCVWMTGFALWRLRRWLGQRPDGDPPQFLGDFFRQSVIRRFARL